VLEALRDNPEFVGYWDADLSTPLDALPDFVAVFEHRPQTTIVIGSRVQLLGRDIDRRPLRHYFGRAFATGASLVLGLPVYDTQCGAKLFRVCRATRGVFERRFRTRWVFDVEVIARYLAACGSDDHPERHIYELSLRTWHDVADSKLAPGAMLRGAADLAWLYFLQLFGRLEPRVETGPAAWPDVVAPVAAPGRGPFEAAPAPVARKPWWPR
jgi:dolichyl-phosphate beta-glucosyltransferase